MVIGAFEVEVEPALGATLSFFKDFRSTAEKNMKRSSLKQSLERIRELRISSVPHLRRFET